VFAYASGFLFRGAFASGGRIRFFLAAASACLSIAVLVYAAAALYFIASID
jgi:hypothetical protein